MKSNVMSAALAAALASAGSASAASKVPGEYLSGDFHNHTTCSDGSTSVRTLTRESLNYLDWFIHVGHSGRGSRNCNISDFLYINRDSEYNRGLWINSLPNGEDDIKGDETFDTVGRWNDRDVPVRAMWRWQSLQEYNLQGIVDEREFPGREDKIAFLGLEWVVPGHEHSSNSISAGNYDPAPNADAIAQFEYCFARNSDDTSGGGGQGWTCELSETGNETIKTLFEGRPEEGPADYNAQLVNGININDAGDHVKSTAGVLWMQENFPGQSFAVQAHVERQGAFVEDDDEGFNVEHHRDWNTVAPGVAYGFESQPGHQAQFSRGSYNAGRPTAGLYTFGGTGCYGAAEAAKPGLDFDGTPLTPADFAAGGKYEVVDDNEPVEKVTLCRPGVRTMWDALLSEGRRFWFFASSDWHSRGSFGPLDIEADNDFYPGEYQENFVLIPDGVDTTSGDRAQPVMDALASGNSYTVQGQLIADDMMFRACTTNRSGFQCAFPGETLKVISGRDVRVTIKVSDPSGENNSPYKFDNPSLLQVGIREPINKPTVRHIDLISGKVTGMIAPTDPEYFNPLAPETTIIEGSWDRGTWKERRNWRNPSQRISIHYDMRTLEADSYIRVRGSNIPAGTPNERDADGNPLRDDMTDNIACSDPACPPHIEGTLNADVEAWADIWFHVNPIFLEIED